MKVDIEKLNEAREKYLEEKIKREHHSISDYVSEIHHGSEPDNFWDDPHTDGSFTREPLTDEVEALVIGGGIGGLAMAVRLHDAGCTDVRIVEKGADFGGAWYWNDYPGAQCDIDASIYLPLLEEMDYVPKNKYAHVSEIASHLRSIGKKYDFYNKALFQTVVEGVTWSDDSKRWTVTTSRGDKISTRYVISCIAQMDTPKLPAIPGIADFCGTMFHTSRWNYDYTGGDSHGGLTKLGDKRVAVIGTGCTSIQCVPHLAEAAEKLYVVQRTPITISERGNHPIDPDWDVAKEPGWQKRRMDNFCAMTVGQPVEEDLIGDKWTHIFRNVSSFLSSPDFEGSSPEEMADSAEMADLEMMEEIRDRVDEFVRDAETAERLKPYYRVFCKRPGFSDTYLPSFNRDNVELLDTEGKGPERFTENGIVIDGEEYEVDCVVFATGFDTSSLLLDKGGFEIKGREGADLSEKWGKQVATLHGYSTSGFPNLFFIGSYQTGYVPNFWHMADEQTQHVAHIIKHCRDNGIATVEPTEEAEQQWVADLTTLASDSKAFYTDCTPSYFNNEGDNERKNYLLEGQYGGGPEQFFAILAQWRAEGEFRGMRLGQ